MTAYRQGPPPIVLNGAVFLNTYDDLQDTVWVPGAVRADFVTVNIAEVETYGAEFQATWLSTDNLRIGFNLGYLHAEYTDFCDDVDGPSPAPFPSDCGGAITSALVDGSTQYLVPEDQTNLDLANAPKWSGSLLVDYALPIDAGTVFFHSDVRYTDDMNTWGKDNDDRLVRDAVVLLNAHVGFQDAGERFDVRIYGRNLTDKEVMSGAISSTSSPVMQFYQPPREFGVEFTVNL